MLARGLKQDMAFNTEITEDENVIIDKQFIGKLKGLKLELDLNVGTLDTDIKSLKKAARLSIGPELNKRIKQIIDTGLLEIKNDFKIYWRKFPIAKLLPGKDYLDPELFKDVKILNDNIKYTIDDLNILKQYLLYYLSFHIINIKHLKSMSLMKQ